MVPLTISLLVSALIAQESCDQTSMSNPAYRPLHHLRISLKECSINSRRLRHHPSYAPPVSVLWTTLTRRLRHQCKGTQGERALTEQGFASIFDTRLKNAALCFFGSFLRLLRHFAKGCGQLKVLPSLAPHLPSLAPLQFRRLRHSKTVFYATIVNRNPHSC